MTAPIRDITAKLRRIASEVSEAPSRRQLAAVALAALARQAEGRTLFVGKHYVDHLAEEHGVDVSSAELPSGNVLSILKAGPSTEAEHQLISALAVRGLSEIGDDTEREAEIRRFARYGVWLEASTRYRVFSFAERQLGEAELAHLHRALAEGLLADDDGSSESRSRNAVRLTVLLDSTAPTAERALSKLRDEARDPFTRAVVDLGSGRGGAEAADVQTIRGRLDMPPPPGGIRGFLRLALGIAFVQWLFRGLRTLVGARARGEVSLTDAGGIRLRKETRLLGRLIRKSYEIHAPEALRAAGRSSRYPAIWLLTGALALSFGIVLGGIWLVDGVRSGDTILLMVGAALILLGGVADLAFSLVSGGRGDEVTVFFRFDRGRDIELSGVPVDDAEAFLSQLARVVEASSS